MKRGQAFDTMMLVISVIVAIAILGLLLGFLGGIGGFGAKAKDVIPDLVKKVQAKGFGLELKENVEFNKGDSIYQRDAIGQAPISKDDLKFDCVRSDASCGTASDSPVFLGSNNLVGNQKISLTVAVCLGELSSTVGEGNYLVLVGKKTAEVRSQAEQDCNLV